MHTCKVPQHFKFSRRNVLCSYTEMELLVNCVLRAYPAQIDTIITPKTCFETWIDTKKQLNIEVAVKLIFHTTFYPNPVTRRYELIVNYLRWTDVLLSCPITAVYQIRGRFDMMNDKGLLPVQIPKVTCPTFCHTD